MVSVVMPVYNSEKYLREAVESILNQTYPNIELIAVDSSDDAGESKRLLLSYGDKIRYIYKEKSGVANALNSGIQAAQGVYVARMDTDDIAMPARIEKQISFMMRHPEIGVCGTGFQYIEASGRMGETVCYAESNDEIASELIFSNPISHPTVVFKGELFCQGWKYNEDFVAEDYNLWTRMIPAIQFANLPEALLLYRRNLEGSTARREKRVVESAALSRRQYIEALFHMSTDAFRTEDFVISTNYSRPNLQEPWCDYIVRQFSLLYQMYQHNQSVQAIAPERMTSVLNRRWAWTLGYLGGSSVFRIYCKSNFLFTGTDESELFLKRLEARYGVNTYIELYQGLWDELQAIYQQFLSFCRQKKRFVIYGMGWAGKLLVNRYVELYQTEQFNWELCAVADKRIEEIDLGDCLAAYPKMKPEEAAREDLDFIVISTPIYFDEIKRELLGLGVAEDKILDSGWILYNL